MTRIDGQPDPGPVPEGQPEEVRLPAPGAAPEPRATTDWCAWWGGEDPNDCAGLLVYDDEEEAKQMLPWIPGSGVAQRTVVTYPWQAVNPGGF